MLHEMGIETGIDLERCSSPRAPSRSCSAARSAPTCCAPAPSTGTGLGRAARPAE